MHVINVDIVAVAVVAAPNRHACSFTLCSESTLGAAVEPCSSPASGAHPQLVEAVLCQSKHDHRPQPHLSRREAAAQEALRRFFLPLQVRPRKWRAQAKGRLVQTKRSSAHLSVSELPPPVCLFASCARGETCHFGRPTSACADTVHCSHHWAVVSGSIDPDDPSPQAAAWREIQEETTLTRSDLELMRQGKSYLLPDESIGREWTIYPFAFRLKDLSEGGKGEEGITLDWEHDEWAWYDPMDVEDSESFGAVPRLAESLRRVWFEKGLGAEAGAVLTNGLDTLKHDQQSGARQLAGRALHILRDIVHKLDVQQPPDEWWTKVRFAAWHIWKNGRESMGAAILTVLLAPLKTMEQFILEQNKKHRTEPVPSDAAEWRNVLVHELERRIAARDDAANAVSVAFTRFLQQQFATRVEPHCPIRMLTLSESSTITHALRHVITNTALCFDLRILESRPLFEGVSLANSLITQVASVSDEPPMVGPSEHTNKPREATSAKLRITLCSDASSALASQDLDILVIGADRIAESGAVSNKTGSLPAILSARHVSPQARIITVSESDKVAPTGATTSHIVEDNDPAQLAHAWEADFNTESVKLGSGTVTKYLGGGSHKAENASAAAHGQFRSHTGSDVGAEARSRAPAAAVHVDIRNVTFEWVPPELIDIYVTEHGIQTVADMRKLSEARSIEEKRLFKDI